MAVGKAVKSGRLSTVNGKWLDEKVAALQWDLNRQRLPPPKKGFGIGRRPVVKTDDPPIDWLLENTTIWLAITIFDRADLRFYAERWLALATGTNDPRLVARLIALLEEIANCVDRVNNPELIDEELEPTA